MELIKPKAKIWEQGTTLEDMWKHIARCTRVCYQSTPKNDEETDEEFVKRVILRNGKEEDFTKLHCYTGDVEVLTINGWVKFENYNGEKVAIIDSNRNFKGYENPISIQHHKYNGNFYYYPELGIKVTDGHKMFGSFRKNNKSFGQCNNFELFKCNTTYIHNNHVYTYGERQFKTANCCNYNNFIDIMIDKWSELLGFWIGDGCHNAFKNQIIFHLRKLDKINYIHNLAKSLNIPYEDVNDYVKLNFEGIGETFNKYYNGITHNKQIINKTYSLKEIAGIIKGLLYSDSDIRTIKNRNTNTIKYATTSKSVYEWIMSNAPLVGYSVNGKGPISRDGNRSDIYYIYFKQNDYTIHNDSRKPQSKVIITNESLDVYCISVSTGIIMVRGSKGISTICGNCSMLEHGTIYLMYRADEEGPGLDKYNYNKYSRFVYKNFNSYVTTNLRVIYEKGWLEDLNYICVPTEHHVKRVTVSFTTNIGVTREFNRHRVNSMAEESTRYCNYTKHRQISNTNNTLGSSTIVNNIIPINGQIRFGLPAWLLDDENMRYIERHVDDDLYSYCTLMANDYDTDWCDIDYYLFALRCAEYCYKNLIRKGWKPQQAREVLPLATKSQLIHTAFIDDWKHFFALRADGVSGTPHPNAKLIAEPLKEEFIKRGLL